MALSVREYRARLSRPSRDTRSPAPWSSSPRPHHQGAAAAPSRPLLSRRADPGGLGGGDVLNVEPLTREPEDPNRAVPMVTSDRGLAGVLLSVRSGGRAPRGSSFAGGQGDPHLHLGRKGEACYSSATALSRRRRPASPTSRQYDAAHDIGQTLIDAFLDEDGEHAVDEVHVVFTRFADAGAGARRRAGLRRSRWWRARRGPPRTRCCR